MKTLKRLTILLTCIYMLTGISTSVPHTNVDTNANVMLCDNLGNNPVVRV